MFHVLAHILDLRWTQHSCSNVPWLCLFGREARPEIAMTLLLSLWKTQFRLLVKLFAVFLLLCSVEVNASATLSPTTLPLLAERDILDKGTSGEVKQMGFKLSQGKAGWLEEGDFFFSFYFLGWMFNQSLVSLQEFQRLLRTCAVILLMKNS